jgi:serine/threonine protein kinase
MPLTAGATLGPYVVEAPLGAGGMGEVYRARDTRLNRTVAIKILSDRLTSTPQFRKRFEREARIIAALGPARSREPRLTRVTRFESPPPPPAPSSSIRPDRAPPRGRA